VADVSIENVNWAKRSAMNERELNDLLPLIADRPPLRADEGEAVRVGESRIGLDLVALTARRTPRVNDSSSLSREAGEMAMGLDQ
jgi:hypothetical protein